MRRGGRTTLYVDLDVLEAPGNRVTIAATHLENRTKPKVRRQQMEELLAHVGEKSNPVIIGGDWNTTGSDATPTSVTQSLYKQFGSLDFWTTKGIVWTTGAGLVYSGTKFSLKLVGVQVRVDPTSANIPGLSPNLERGLFKTLEKFRFDDGQAFDFRGIPERTVYGKGGTLGDSNERLSKGFAPTFVTEFVLKKARVAKFRLDWIVVKSELDNPRDRGPILAILSIARVGGEQLPRFRSGTLFPCPLGTRPLSRGQRRGIRTHQAVTGCPASNLQILEKQQANNSARADRLHLWSLLANCSDPFAVSCCSGTLVASR